MVLFDRIPMPVAVCDPHGTVRLVNAAFALEWGTTAGRLKGRAILDLFRPVDAAQVDRIAQAQKQRRRSRYTVAVAWRGGDGVCRRGELIVDTVSDTSDRTPDLLVTVRVGDVAAPVSERPPSAATAPHPQEARILALLAAGATTARAARETGLTTDGVTYHLRQLSRRWGASNRTELVARAYAEGVLVAGVWPPRVASAR
ncbi:MULTISPECIES: PAS domain-containing protein [unclassified Streptomyces]|uniref:PAS domain-containing protein n=1 Tax=unclassified Streptomyces TaxID=2593676 RepID=UPI00278C5FF3|nr:MULTISPECIES: PAS domain-containing protein [unclassified Streptomyces]